MPCQQKNALARFDRAGIQIDGALQARIVVLIAGKVVIKISIDSGKT